MKFTFENLIKQLPDEDLRYLYNAAQREIYRRKKTQKVAEFIKEHPEEVKKAFEACKKIVDKHKFDKKQRAIN